MLKLVVGILISLPMVVQANSGADDLLKSLGGGKTALSAGQGVDLSDPFLGMFYAEVMTAKDLSYNARQWANMILAKKYRDAAHLWSSLEFPDSFEPSAKAAYLYCLWKINLPQTFVSHWLRFLKDQDFARSRILVGLEQLLLPAMSQWIDKNPVLLTQEQKKFLGSIDLRKHPSLLTLRAVSMERSGLKAEKILSLLPMNHPLRLSLAKTVTLGYVKKGELGKAAGILKKHLEPALEAKGSPVLLADHYLTIARLLYQGGQLDGAQTYYEKIPNSTPQFVKAREELLWVLLRKGDTEKLRGEVKSLSLPVFAKTFNPELHVVRAVSNIKFCYYGNVKNDLDLFFKENKTWASKIDGALAQSAPPRALEPDLFSLRAEKIVAAQDKEKKELQKLSKESITAVLPAVGPQKHWTLAMKELSRTHDLSLKARDAEYRRQWKNLHRQLAEAIKKMKFVRVELMSQVRRYSKLKKQPGKLVAANKLPKGGITTKSSDLSFPTDNVFWPDEMFRMRAAAQNRCLKLAKDLK